MIDRNEHKIVLGSMLYKLHCLKLHIKKEIAA